MISVQNRQLLSNGNKNFRYDVATLRPYKGNRESPPWQEYFKPILKQHYIDKWNLIPMSDIEADDAVIIAHHQFKDKYDIIHVGEDKDMRQLGDFKRYNLRTKKIEYFERESGRKFFWSQLLHGDQSDNIQGIEGIGAGKKGGETSKNPIVMELWKMNNPSEEEMFNYVKEVYIKKYGINAKNIMTENYILLKMLTNPCFDYPKNIELIPYKINNQYKIKKLLDI